MNAHKDYSNQGNAARAAKKTLGHEDFITKQNSEGRWEWSEKSLRRTAEAPLSQEKLISELKHTQVKILDLTKKLRAVGVHVNANGSVRIPKPSQNGVSQPASGTLCRTIWDWCDDYNDKHNEIPTAAEIKAKGEKAGWNNHTTLTQFARWRKFNGVS